MLIRHLTGQPPAQAKRATELLATSERLILTDLVAAECVYVLQSVYELDRPRTALLLRSAIALRSIDAPGESVLLRSLELYESTQLGFADAYLVAGAEQSGVGVVASFDQGIDGIGTVERLTG